MPALVLSHRYSPDSNALFAAAVAAGWDVERLHTFRCPEGLAARAPVFYGETLLADAHAVLADVTAEIPPAVVIDVGRMTGRGWGVVEANPAWASGLCGCDPMVVLEVLRRAAVPATRATAEDQRWARATPPV